MNKFKTSLYGYHKQSIEQLLKKLQTEHELKKLALEHELTHIKTLIEKIK